MVLEDPHHTFVDCPQFTSLRILHTSELHLNIKRILQTLSLSMSDQAAILHKVEHLFLDSDTWPAQWSLFYLGMLLPLLPPRFQKLLIHTHIAHECHSTSICLAAQIWGAAHCANCGKIYNCLNHQLPQNHATLTLPSHLSHILPPSPSYPSFSISFTWSLHLHLHLLCSWWGLKTLSCLCNIVSENSFHFISFWSLNFLS